MIYTISGGIRGRQGSRRVNVAFRAQEIEATDEDAVSAAMLAHMIREYHLDSAEWANEPVIC